MDEKINIVDIEGNRIGSIGKLEAHEKGILHELFILLLMMGQQIILQKRNPANISFGGL